MEWESVFCICAPFHDGRQSVGVSETCSTRLTRRCDTRSFSLARNTSAAVEHLVCRFVVLSRERTRARLSGELCFSLCVKKSRIPSATAGVYSI